jgi:hypothetical protein
MVDDCAGYQICTVPVHVRPPEITVMMALSFVPEAPYIFSAREQRVLCVLVDQFRRNWVAEAAAGNRKTLTPHLRPEPRSGCIYSLWEGRRSLCLHLGPKQASA